jgi:PAS domain S-box-containing protein
MDFFNELMIKVIEETSDGFLILNPKKEIIFFNEVFLRMMGLRSIDIFSHEKDLLRTIQIEDGKESKQTIEMPDQKGVSHTFLLESFPVENVLGRYFLLRVNPYQLIPEEKFSSKEKYELLFNSIGDPLYTADFKGKILSCNLAFLKFLHLTEGSENTADIASFYVDQDELEDKIIRLLNAKSIYNLETHLFIGDKEVKRVLDSSWLIEHEDGVATGYCTHLRDISYIHNLEQRLHISERNYLMLLGSILSAMIIVDPLGNILNWNYAAEKFYGYKWEEVVGRDFDDIACPDKKHRSIESIIKLVDENNGRYMETDVPRQCKDTTIRFTFASYSALTNSEGETIAYSIMEKDLTERIKLERKLAESFDQLKQTQAAAILGFARLTEYRDKNTGKHLERIREYTRVMATALAELPKYRNYISDEYIEDLCLSSILHDVGKVGIEDSILTKPGKLDPNEFNRIKDHTKFGGDALSEADRHITKESFLTIGKEIAYYHHEHWDGNGYPKGLKGKAIPLSARIVALADVYDALTSDRSYKQALPHEEAVEIIKSERGTHFDPDIIDVFLKNQEVFSRINRFIAFQENPESIGDLLNR